MAHAQTAPRWRAWTGPAALVLIVLLAVPFVLHSATFGIRGLLADLSAETRLHLPGRASNAAISVHMVAGAVVTLAAPFQLITPLRRRFPALHRWTGRTAVAAALVAALGGLWHIAERRTIGGLNMDVGFALYGAALGLAAVQAARHARARRIPQHRAWAIRLFALAMGSLLFRVHYGVWFAATGGLGVETETLSGPFDRIQVWAFWIPYLILAEIWIGRGHAKRSGDVGGDT